MLTFWIEVKNGAPGAYACDASGARLVFPDGVSAAAHADSMNRNARDWLWPQRYMVRREESVEQDSGAQWRERERGRFDSGTYTILPWAGRDFYANASAVADHFAHVALKTPELVAYTPDESSGRADRQVSTTPARYLGRYFGDVLSATDIRFLVGEYLSLHGVAQFNVARDADDIERVYRCGPDSCMSHAPGDYESPCHPVRAYAGPDLGVAYIEVGDRITARAVCWPDKKVYTRIFGDESRFQANAPADWEQGSLRGARIACIKAGDSYVAPYVDYISFGGIEGAYIVLGRGEDVVLSNTNGLGGDSRDCCAHCGDRFDEDDLTSVDWYEGLLCDSCWSELVFQCAQCDEHASVEDACSVTFGDGRTRYVCESCADDVWLCDSCESNIISDAVTKGTQGGNFCEHCAGRVELTPCGSYPEGQDTNQSCDCSTCLESRGQLTLDVGEVAA